MEQKDVALPETIPVLDLPKHIEYIANYSKKTDDVDYLMSEHLRMSGIYWCLTGMWKRKRKRERKRERVCVSAVCMVTLITLSY